MNSPLLETILLSHLVNHRKSAEEMFRNSRLDGINKGLFNLSSAKSAALSVAESIVRLIRRENETLLPYFAAMGSLAVNFIENNFTDFFNIKGAFDEDVSRISVVIITH